MPRIDVSEAVKEFCQKLENDYYPFALSKNSEEDYSKEKELRDSAAVHDSIGTPYFEFIKNMK